MNQPKWFFHPVSVFILSIIALGMSLFLYIYWYVEVSADLDAVVRRFNLEPDKMLASETWVVIMVLSILVAVILAGIFVIFVYNQKTYQLYRLQNNFINNFTHELKTPVTSIRLYLETFLKTEITGKDREKYIGYMLSDVQRLGDNINSILSLARIESKNFKGDFIHTDLEEFIKQFCDSNSHLFQQCMIIVNCSVKQPLMHPVDTSLFEMLLMNLLTNAVNHNESDIPRVDINLFIKDAKIHISFSDNGMGIRKSEMDRIFDPGYSTKPSGTGLGLAIVEKIIIEHGGEIRCESEYGSGTKFVIDLPIETEEDITYG